MSIFKHHLTRWILDGKRVPANTPGATKKRGRTKKWYGDVPRPEGGKPLKVPLSTNRAVALQMYADLMRRAERIRTGQHVPSDDHVSTPLTKHLDDFAATVRAGSKKRTKPPTPFVVDRLLRRVRAVLDGCSFAVARDLCPVKVQSFLTGLASDRSIVVPDRPTFTMAEVCALLSAKPNAVGAGCRRMNLLRLGRGPATRYPRDTVIALAASKAGSRGFGQTTIAAYGKAIRRFTRWLAKHGRTDRDPLAEMEVACPENDNRHQRRPLSPDELERFLTATRASERRYRRLTGLDRWTLYLTALATGFRRGELATLAVSQFLLGHNPPVVVLAESETKNDKGAIQPIPSHVVAVLRDYLSGRPAESIVWPGTWHLTAAEMIRLDLREAGVAYIAESADGPLFADFHGTRHSFVAMLKRSGATLSQAMRLARHSDPKLTMRVYGREDLGELSDAVGKIDLVGEKVGVSEANESTKPLTETTESKRTASKKTRRKPNKNKGDSSESETK